MKNRSLLPLVALMILSLVVSSAAAQTDLPGPGDPRPDREAGTSQRPALPLDESGDAFTPHLAPGLEQQETNSPGLGPEVTPGTPGLSYRHIKTFGVTEEAYDINDHTHLNGPNGLFIDGSNNVFIVEEQGMRLQKFNSGGTFQFSIGKAGLDDVDEYLFSWPRDVTLDASGNIWVVDNNRVTQYNSSGNFLQVFPTWVNRPWRCYTAPDNTGFCDPRGLAFDSAGRLFVSDADNNRIQIFEMGSGSPVYSATISGFNYPTKIAFDNQNRLYVADAENYVIKRCTFSGGWSCNVFHGTGVWGGGDAQLKYVEGLASDPGGNNIFIADSENGRVKKCTLAGSCSTFGAAMDFWWPSDVAVDSSGSVFVSDWDQSLVYKFNAAGTSSTIFKGEYGVPYTTHHPHLNNPWGVAVAGDGNIYVVEEYGRRLIKLNPAGGQVWTVGQPGIWGEEDEPYLFSTLRGSPAIDASGRIYVSDTRNHIVKIYNSDGTFFGSIGTGDWGSGNDQFDDPHGIAISPLNGDIYVADRDNNRVQIFTSNLNYKDTLDLNDVGGDFLGPRDVEVGQDGRVLVADRERQRVQVFNSSLVYQFTIGTPDEEGEDFDHLAAPAAVTTDTAGRIFIADQWNNRIQVFDSTGAYLTTISGEWGAGNSQLRNPMGVAVDADGYVYVTDRTNHRIQKFSPHIPNWEQVNLNGFADLYNGNVLALGVFEDTLYAGTYNSDGPGELWRLSGSNSWSKVTGFGSANTRTADTIVEFKDKLYVGTYEAPTSNDYLGGIWRSDDGSTWSPVVTDGFGNPLNGELLHMAVFSDTLYAAPYGYYQTHGLELYRSSSGDPGSWSLAAPYGFGDSQNIGIYASAVYSDCLFVGTQNYNRFTDGSTGAEVWRTCDASNWQQVNADGFGDSHNTYVSAMAVFQSRLYVSTRYAGAGAGANLYRCQICDDTDWEHLEANGVFDSDNDGLAALIEFDGALFWAISNDTVDGGIMVLRSINGETWEPVGWNGFGDPRNYRIFLNQGAAVFNNQLYLSTNNWTNGGEIWRYLDEFTHKIFLPTLKR